MNSTPLIGVAPLMRQAFMDVDLRPLGAALLARAQADPDDANAVFDFSTVLQLTGEREAALAVQMEAIRIAPLYSIPATLPTRLRLLAIMGPGDLMSNTPIEFLLEESDVALDMLFLTLDTPWPETVPDHDVLIVCTAESEANRDLLPLLAQLVADWPRPVINRPERIAVLSRDGVCAALEGVAGMLLPENDPHRPRFAGRAGRGRHHGAGAAAGRRLSADRAAFGLACGDGPGQGGRWH